MNQQLSGNRDDDSGGTEHNDLAMILATARQQSLGGMLRRSAMRHHDRTAIICGDTRWTYAEFDRVVDCLAAGLKRAGVNPGDRLALLARNSHAFMALRFAIARADAVLVPINFMLNADDVRYILEHSGARMLFVDRSTADVGSAARPDSVERIIGIAGEHHGVPDGFPSWEELFCDDGVQQDTRGGSDRLCCKHGARPPRPPPFSPPAPPPPPGSSHRPKRRNRERGRCRGEDAQPSAVGQLQNERHFRFGWGWR